jgi:penicillin-binding protein 2
MYLRNKTATKVDFSSFTENHFREDNSRYWKYVSIYVLIGIIFIFLIVNLFTLQIIDGREYLVIASRTNQSRDVILPPRGIIYDINGRELAINVPSYSLFLNPQEINSDEEDVVINEIALVIGASESELLEQYKEIVYENEEKLSINRVTIQTGIEFSDYIDWIGKLDNLTGVYIETEAMRYYPNAEYFSHILGYTGDPNQDDIDRGIYPRSQVGKIGIEKEYDSILRGVEGIKVSERGVIDERNLTYTPQEAKYGDNIYLTIDYEWQTALTDILAAQIDEVNAFAGASVVINSRTGEVKALVSLPSYNNQLFVRGISQSDYSILINDPETPLMNRVTGLQLPPGSIFKIVGAAAALEEGITTRDRKVLSDRCLELPGEVFFCEADRGYLGHVDIVDSLSKSSNIYFCNMALELNSSRRGIRTQIEYAEMFGIGSRTGIDLSGEQPGSMASPELKRRLWNEPWYLGDECNTIIGQGFVTTTPLQMAVLISAISNGGDVVQPHILLKAEDQAGRTVYSKELETVKKLDLSDKTINIINEGLKRAAGEGTAAMLGNIPGNPIAKTGSAEAGEIIRGEYYSGAHSWVIGCFDYAGENYCMAIIQQWGGRGYRTVPVMRKLINCIYNDFSQNCENI